MSNSSGRLNQLDGLRAIAVGGVVVQHGLGLVRLGGHGDGFALGSVGVRLFFVLSGFLITGILLRCREQAAAADVSRWFVWRAFYYRRALRILPLAYVVLAFAWMAGSPTIQARPWMFVTYTSNYYVASHGLTDPSLDHFWSLAIEEQFYLFWPVVVLALPRRWLFWAMLAVTAASMAARAVILASSGVHAAYVLTPSRLDALAIGGLLAWYQLHHRPSVTRVAAALLAGGVAARLLARAFAPSPLVLPLPETGYVLVSAAIVFWASEGIPGVVGRFLSSRPLVEVGTMSYGIYVYHMVIAGLAPIVAARLHVANPFPSHDGWSRFAWMIVTTSPVAAASWYWFERPLNDLKARFPYVPGVRRFDARAATPDPALTVAVADVS
jgi:peptidoglycan/LPS O-acetylase OafA/YrhL